MKIPVKSVNLPESLFIAGKSYGLKVNQDNVNNKELQMFYDTEQKGVIIIRNHTDCSFIPNGAYNNIVLVTGKDWVSIDAKYEENFRLSTDRLKIVRQEPADIPINIQAQVWTPSGGVPMEQPVPTTKAKRKITTTQVEGEK